MNPYDRLSRWLELPLVASVQPTPIEGLQSVVGVELLNNSSPVAATLNGIRSPTFVLSEMALAQVDPPPDPNLEPSQALWEWSQRAVRSGWRHVAAPDVAGPTFLTGETANEQLLTQQLWARTRSLGMNLIVDGRCFGPSGPPTGTHHVIAELTRHLCVQRPNVRVTLAVGSGGQDRARQAIGDHANLAFEEWNRLTRRHFDVIYRPYQFLREDEVAWTFEIADRVVLGQLDTIGFSNTSYHPSKAMFQAARNLQRATLRRADRVVTISEFSAAAIRTEVPDLEPDRLSIVPCGADHIGPVEPRRPTLPTSMADTPFLLCLSATFWHKNRLQAIKTTLELRRRGVDIALVIAGPEPFYGSSVPAENALLERSSDADRAAVVRVGPVGEAEKWWLLTHASVVLYPSVVEGFGLVPFEAATVGTPALMAKTAALPEVFGEGVFLIESWDPTEWANVVSRWQNEPTAAVAQVASIAQRAVHLSWSNAAASTWAVLDETLGRAKRLGHDSEGARYLSMEAHRVGGTRVGHSVRFATRVLKFLGRVAKRSRES